MKTIFKIFGILIILATLVWASFELINLINIGSMAEADPTMLIAIISVGAIVATVCLSTEDYALPIVLPIVGSAMLCFEVYSAIAIFMMPEPLFGDVSNITAGVIHICSGVVIAGLTYFAYFKMFQDLKSRMNR
jgi:hypothetical protein